MHEINVFNIFTFRAHKAPIAVPFLALRCIIRWVKFIKPPLRQPFGQHHCSMVQLTNMYRPPRVWQVPHHLMVHRGE